MRRIQAWLSGRVPFLIKNGSLKPGDPDGELQPARVAPTDPPPVPPIAMGGTITMGRSPVFHVGVLPTESWLTHGFIPTATTGTPTNPLTGPHCQCHETPPAPSAEEPR